ncbi:hypothetical protein [Devosia rhizoryzae]|uniref:Uncharacterized protein n=1 Tax=Devosia rhizoryzae TaxID=2774137 RepID=A0ABX7C4R1_9HYPH|nr:hypothetical protein [Devosia rhizoryzae]QQR39229.1 hypothetical protein JI748_16120 [Devosia rhizoryzae]
MRMKPRALAGALLALTLAAGFASPAWAQATDVDFGDDSSEWANDGECDDPRFAGSGMAAELEDADILKDATDCRAAFEAGNIAHADTPVEAPVAETVAPPVATTAAADVDFGDDTSSWANDGECDDPRFSGTGMAVELEDADILKDATDCRTAFEAGTISIAETGDIPAATTDTAAIDFGDDSSEWARDEECDDPRFAGSAMAGTLNDVNIGKDATDCEAAFNAGTVTLAENAPNDTGNSGDNTALLTAIAGRIDFGDDSGDYPNDGECDDPDFVGSAMALEPVENERLGDATDCRAAFIAGTVSLRGAATQPAAFDYGSDTSAYANDGECDDWRFAGSAMSKKLFSEDVLGDASDCQALEQSGAIAIKRVYQPGYAENGPYDSSNIDFGNNSSTYANDNLCDDPRFEGPGTAVTLLDSDRMADADDCRTAYEAGTVDLREGQG